METTPGGEWCSLLLSTDGSLHLYLLESLVEVPFYRGALSEPAILRGRRLKGAMLRTSCSVLAGHRPFTLAFDPF